MNVRRESLNTMKKNQLPREAFREKYWADGQLPNQIHTMEIEQGETEKEQLIINNINGLVDWYFELKRDNQKQRTEIENEVNKKCRMTILISVTASAIFTILMCWAIKK